MAVTPTCHQSRHFSANNFVAVSSVGDVRTGTRSALNAFSHAHERKREKERKGGWDELLLAGLDHPSSFSQRKKQRRRLFTITLHYRVPLTRFPFSIYEPCFLIVDFFCSSYIPEYVFMLPRSYKIGTLGPVYEHCPLTIYQDFRRHASSLASARRQASGISMHAERSDAKLGWF